MSRNRIIKPSFWDDEKMAKLSMNARLTYIGIWNHCDDYGVVIAAPAWLLTRLFPYDIGRVTVDDFHGWLKELESISRLVPFEHRGEHFYYLPKFLDHQRIDRPSKQRFAEPPQHIVQEQSESKSDELDEPSTSTPGTLGDEAKLSQAKYKLSQAKLKRSTKEAKGDDRPRDARVFSASALDGEEDPIEWLVSFKVNKAKAQEIAGRYEHDFIFDKIDHYSWQARNGKAKGPGYLVSSIEEQYPPPKGYEEYVEELKKSRARERSNGEGEPQSLAEAMRKN